MNKSLIILVTCLMMGCSTVPQPTRTPVPPFPKLDLKDYPGDPLGFCLSKDDAARLGQYIKQLQVR